MKTINTGCPDFAVLKNLIFACYFIFSSFQISAQWLVTTPECVSYDETYNRYLVSCFYSGKVVAIDSLGSHSYFKTGLGNCYGSTIYGNVFYMSTGNTIRGFSLATGAQVMSVYIAGSHQLDGMTADSAGNLYIADFHYQGSNDQIFKLNTTSQAYWAFVPPGHGLQECPQDIAYDKLYNRLLVVSCYQTPILAINLADTAITTVFSSATICNFDGIAQDNLRNFYASSWQTGYVYKFDPNFAQTPEAIEGPFNGPSNLCYNPERNILAIPVFNADTLIFHVLEPSGINIESEVLREFILYQNYPNPFNPITKIKFDLPSLKGISRETVKLIICDMLGREIAVLVNEVLKSGTYEVEWNASNYSGGIYFYKLSAGKYTECKKMVLIK